MLSLYAAGTDPVAAVVFLVLMGGALGPVFMTTQNEMLHCAPGRTDIARAANSGAYNAGIAAGAALGGLVLSLADVRGAFLVGGLLTVGACAVLLAGRLLPRSVTRAGVRTDSSGSTVSTRLCLARTFGLSSFVLTGQYKKWRVCGQPARGSRHRR
ncbi:hypothetical protein ACFVXE_29060 [Streptomyces sp. NPDC058231]|uniref:hypothetical protein n=1 Tax=Streptomyces sp. NPDC058231 TaxID=3346392 RepID=UPI0036E12A07